MRVNWTCVWGQSQGAFFNFRFAMPETGSTGTGTRAEKLSTRVRTRTLCPSFCIHRCQRAAATEDRRCCPAQPRSTARPGQDR